MSKQYLRHVPILIMLSLLFSSLAGAVLAAPLRAISSYQATNTSTNVAYQLNYTGTYSFFRVYIDTDQNAATGYNANGIGANYMVENGGLYSHPANDSAWSWTSLGAVTFTNAGGVASWTIARSAIGETANPNSANLVFQVETPLTTSAIYTHTYSGAGPTATRTNTPIGPTATRTRTPTVTNTSVPAGCGTTNVALNKAATSSSNESAAYTPNLAVDGNTTTRWASAFSDPQWIQIDLGSTQSICRVVLTWEAAYGSAYQIQVSGSATGPWSNIYSTTTGNGTSDDLTGLSGSGRYIRMNGTVRATAWGYSLWEFAVYTGSGPTATSGPSATPSRTPTPGGGGSTTVTYSANTAVITNPERGFLHTNTACESSLYSVSTLQNYRTAENISLLLCNFYLTSFKTSPISQAALNTLQTQLNTIRSAGLKVVLRFAYTQTDNVDASLAQVLAHIDQLAPIIQSNTDVILVWQAGFIGEWGEWYYTNHFGDMGVISSQQWADPKAVVDKMLAVLPSTRMVSLRTPLFARTMYGTTAVSSGTAFNGSAIARLGQHNDAFMASPDDMGTYSNTSVEYPWLQSQSSYTPMGGENAAWAPPRSDCPTTLQELGMFHWSYLNIDYHPTTISNWNSQGCLVTMRRNLGYRFVLTQGTYPNSAAPGGPLNVQISIRNDGYAAPFNPRGRELILRNTSSGAIYRFPLTSDPRFWLAGTTVNINQTITLPGNIPAGSYALLLNLPDGSSSLSANPLYSIQAANTGTWEANTGFNNLLKTVTIP